MRGSSRVVTFATANRGKILEARVILAPLGIRVRPFNGKGVEIQSDTVAEVAASSARAASRSAGRPLIVEDAGLFVEGLGGFPGPASSYVYRTIGIRGLMALLEGARSRRARFESAVAFCEPKGEPLVFEGVLPGRIARSPTGANGFAFDSVFVPSRSRRSIGEMTLEEKCSISHRGEALRKFAAWYTGSSAGQRF